MQSSIRHFKVTPLMRGLKGNPVDRLQRVNRERTRHCKRDEFCGKPLAERAGKAQIVGRTVSQETCLDMPHALFEGKEGGGV